MADNNALGRVYMEDHDPRWFYIAHVEKNRLRNILRTGGANIEHFGSTAIPGLVAKPVIDMVGCIPRLELSEKLRFGLARAGYVLHDVGFARRNFFRREATVDSPPCHLHLVVFPDWPLKNELLLRDWLLDHPEAAHEYGELKRHLARLFPNDMTRYTAGKTELLRLLVNRARAASGLPDEVDWSE